MNNHLQLIRFSKQYIILPNDKKLLEDNYVINSIGMFNVYSSKDLAATVLNYENQKVIILGILFDTRDHNKAVKSIVNDLLNFEIDSNQFLTEMSYYNGRYVILIESGQEVYFYNDATSFLSMYYHKNYPVYSSHSAQLNILLKHFYDCEEIRLFHKTKGFLDLSKYENIFKFNSNLRFKLLSHQMKRIYPVNNYIKKDVIDVYSEVIKNMESSVEAILQLNSKILISLTGGYDSRLSLALMKKHMNNVSFFTYIKNDNPNDNSRSQKIYTIDKKVTKNIVNQLNLNHRFFYIDQKQSVRTVEDIYEEYESNHAIQLIQEYHLDEFYHNKVHVKSTLYELAKGISIKGVDNESLKVDEYLSSLIRWSPNSDELWVKNKLYEFIERCQINDFIALGYDFYDILYLESRLNGWHSTIIQESDPYLEVLNIVNSRHILFNFMQIDYKQRKELQFHKHLINQKWSLLEFFSVNENTTLISKVSQLKAQLAKLKSEKKELHPPKKSKLSYQTTYFNRTQGDRGSLFLRNEQLLEENQLYKLVIKNDSNQSLDIEIKTYYKNQKGKKRLYITVNNDRYDIVDFSDYHFIYTLESNEEMNILIEITKTTDKMSWIRAAMFEVIEY